MISPPQAPLSLALACPSGSFWERWCRNASPEQKQHILPAATRSGIVQLHQLPVPGHPPTRNAVQAVIAAVVANRPPALEWTPPARLQAIDGELDEDQRHALAIALGSPDSSLIAGHPGSGKSRLVAEILRQAVRSGRVLFVAPTGAALDRVIDGADDLAPHLLRCCGAGETLPPKSAAVSLAERVRDFDRHTLPAARKRVEEAREHLDRLAPPEDAWPRLRAIPARLAALAAKRDDLRRQRETLASVVEARWSSGPVDGSPPEWEDIRRKHVEHEREIEARLREVAERLQAIRLETTRLEDERVPLATQAADRSSNRRWTFSFWKSRRQPDPAPALAELDGRLAAVRAGVASLEQERIGLEEARRGTRDEHAALVAGLCRDEVRRREAEIAREHDESVIASAALEAEWAAVLPGGVDPAAVEVAERAWRADREAAAEELARRDGWLSALEQARPGLAFDFVLGARILAAPASELLTLGTDRSPGAFDLLVIDDAHRLGEKELLALTHYAPRCVLVGEPGLAPPKALPSPRVGPARQPDPSCAGVFHRLWAALHPDPTRLPTAWGRRGDRLVARLHPYGAEDEARIDREPVFDRPEIELAIRTPPGADPQLVEVGFPLSMSGADARSFLYRESGELAIQSPGPGFRWAEGADHVHVHFGPSGANEDDRVAFGAGVVEHLGRGASARADDSGWYTLGLSFARADGWDRASAADWLAERLGLRDFGRSACLSRVYRGRPALASFLSELLFTGQPAAAEPPRACDGVEFVPCGEPRDWTSRQGGQGAVAPSHANGTKVVAPQLARPRLGAGFEVELGDGRRLEAVGPELRSGLPPRGIVNLPEASLVVRTLESLAADLLCLPSAGGADPHVAVLSLYPAQIELLRLLVRRSTGLAESGLRVVVGHPSALAHRECPVVCLSLTRSHASRAVPFSDDPRDLVLALTRATERLIVFGDPGTMARRSQWFGALDHLTEATGPVEQTLLGRLLAHLPERAAPVRPAVALESSGV